MGQLTDELQEPGPQNGQDGQASKWGFVPGDDNTTDLDLERNGVPPWGLPLTPALSGKPRMHIAIVRR